MSPGGDPLVGRAFLARPPLLDAPGGPFDQWSWWRLAGLAPPEPAVSSQDHGAALAAVAAAGGRSVLLAVEWAMVAPHPGVVDDDVLEGYRQLCDDARRAGLEPVLVLERGSHPAWMGDELWLTPGSPDLFAEHASRVVGRLAGVCRHWVTLLGPGQQAAAGWVVSTAPPRRRWAFSDAWVVLDNLLTAHLLAEQVIRRSVPDAVVALGYHASDCPGAHRLYDLGPMTVDLLASRVQGLHGEARWDWLATRRLDHDRSQPAATATERGLRWALGRLSPFGRPNGWRRRGPQRVLREPMNEARGPDAVLIVWDDPSPATPAAMAERLAFAARAHPDLQRWLLVPAAGAPDTTPATTAATPPTTPPTTPDTTPDTTPATPPAAPPAASRASVTAAPHAVDGWWEASPVSLVVPGLVTPPGPDDDQGVAADDQHQQGDTGRT